MRTTANYRDAMNAAYMDITGMSVRALSKRISEAGGYVSLRDADSGNVEAFRVTDVKSADWRGRTVEMSVTSLVGRGNVTDLYKTEEGEFRTHLSSVNERDWYFRLDETFLFSLDGRTRSPRERVTGLYAGAFEDMNAQPMKAYSLTSVDGRIKAENARVKNPSKHTFYHGTLSSDWADFLKENPNKMVHAGSKYAAFERGYATASEREMPNGVEFFVYEVRIHPEALIADTPVSDLEDMWVHTWDSEYHDKTDVFTYLNVFEDFDSAALYSRASALEVVKVSNHKIDYSKRRQLASRN